LKKRTLFVIGYLLVFLSVQVCSVGLTHTPEQRTSHSATLSSEIYWADDFNDGNYDGWTVTRGALDASDGVLRGITTTWNWIYCNSTINNGTWSFDVYYAGFDGFNVWFICNYIQPGSYYRPWDGYFVHLSEYTSGTIQLKRDWDGGQVVLDSYDPPGSLDGWWNIEVDRSSDGWITVRVNGTECMQVQDDKWSESLYFFYESYNLQAIDNVEVGDFEVTTTPTTTTTSTTTTTPATGQGILAYLLSNPILLAAIITAVATVCAAGIKRSRG
jgi:hypothetical protein